MNRRTPAALGAAVLMVGLSLTPASADEPVQPARPAVWWLVPPSAEITNGAYPRPTAWLLGEVEYGVADNGHLYGNGVDLGTPCEAPAVEPVEAPEPVVVEVPGPTVTVTVVNHARVDRLRAKVAKLRAQLRAAR